MWTRGQIHPKTVNTLGLLKLLFVVRTLLSTQDSYARVIAFQEDCLVLIVMFSGYSEMGYISGIETVFSFVRVTGLCNTSKFGRDNITLSSK